GAHEVRVDSFFFSSRRRHTRWEEAMRYSRTSVRSLLATTALAFVAAATMLAPRLAIAAPATCATLATDPANGLAGNPVIKSATSAIVPAAGSNVSYCRVQLVYGTNANQN